MKNLLIAFIGLLLIASCKKKDEPIAVDGVAIPSTAIVAVNLTVKLMPTVTPENAADKSVTWASSDANIVAVADDGTVTGKSPGTADITATSKSNPDKSARCTVTVTAAVDGVTIPLTATVEVNLTVKLTPTVTPENATDKSVTWTSSDINIATVADDGTVTGKSPGTAAIKATSKSNSEKSATCTVTVVSNDASVSAITLGNENIPVTVPAVGETVALTNAPRTILSALAAVKVTLTVAAHATVKKGDDAFVSGNTADFNAPVTFTVTAQNGVTVRTYTVAIAPYNAETNPYGIYTAAHLNDVRNGLRDSYKMMNDITLPDRNAAGDIGISDYVDKGWLPIGGLSLDDPKFMGKFDGGNFSINNFYINRGGDEGYTGLFGELRGAVRNLGITGSAVTGGRYVGALAGQLYQGSVTNCYAHVTVHSVLEHYEAFAGGLIGSMIGGSVSNSYSSGDVSGELTGSEFGEGLNIGGLVGVTATGATLSNCFSTGNISAVCRKIYGGGLAGRLGAYQGGCTTVNCYATGNVACTSGGNNIGRLGSSAAGNTFTNCYGNSESLLTSDGAAVTESSPSGVTNKTKAEMQTDAFKGNLTGTVWGQNSAKNGGLPYIIGVGVGK